MRTFLLGLGLILFALPGCDTVDELVGGFTTPSQQELDALSANLECPVLGISASASGRLESSDCRLSDDSSVDYFATRVVDTADLRVTMSSDDVEPYVLLLNGEGVVLEQTGAEPGDNSVSLTYRVEPGLYLIGANSVTAGQSGRYTLRVERR